MASSRSDQPATKQQSDQPITRRTLLGRSQAARYYRRLRESRYLTTFPWSIRARLAEMGQAPGRLWFRIRSAYEGRRANSADTPSSQKIEFPHSSLMIVLEAPHKVTSSIRGLSEGAVKLGTAQATRYKRRLRESRYLTTFPQSIRARFAELGQAPRRLWLRVRSAYETRRTTSANPPPSQRIEQPQSGLMIVLEARDKATSSIRSLSEGATKLGPAAISGVAATDELTASLRQTYSTDGGSAAVSSRFGLPGWSFRGIPSWLLIGSAVVLLVAIPLVVLQVVSPRFGGLGTSSAQVSGEPSSGGSEGQTSGSSDASPSVGGATIQGADFTGAYILEVRHLSSTRTMIRILVPSGVEGEYQALVEMSQASEFQCVVLENRTDELFCIGPRLHTGKAEISIYRLNAEGDSPALVFEVSYLIVEDTIRPGPMFPGLVPTVAPYGTGFIWPDRFNKAEVEREAASNSVLAPASALVTMLVIGVWLLPRPKSDSDRRRTR